MPLWPQSNLEPVALNVTALELWYEKTGVAPILTSGTWSLANRVVYVPVFIPRVAEWIPVILIGGAVSGLVQVGIYNDAGGYPGERIWASNINAPTVINDFLLPAGVSNPPVITYLYGNGLYWLAAQIDNITCQVIRVAALTASGVGPNGAQAGIFYEDLSAIGLPDVATPVVANGIALNVPLLAVTR